MDLQPLGDRLIVTPKPPPLGPDLHRRAVTEVDAKRAAGRAIVIVVNDSSRCRAIRL